MLKNNPELIDDIGLTKRRSRRRSPSPSGSDEHGWSTPFAVSAPPGFPKAGPPGNHSAWWSRDTLSARSSLMPAAGCWRNGKSVAVGQRGLALLEALLDAGGGVVTKADLMERAWPGTIVEEGNLTVQIAALRKSLGTAPMGRNWIATVPRVGYRLVRRRPDRERRRFGQPALAVLPFANLGGDPEQDYFADGMVEDIITALSRFRVFAVIARNSSFVYKGRAVDVRQVAQGTRRPLRARRQRAARGRAAADHRAAGRRRHRRASLGREVRRRAGGRVRLPGPDHRERRDAGRATYPGGGDRALATGAAGKHRGLRHLPAGVDQDLHGIRQRTMRRPTRC